MVGAEALGHQAGVGELIAGLAARGVEAGGPLCCKPVGDVSQMCEVLGGYEWGYVAGRWVWSNAAAKSRVRGWKLCHAACLQAVSRASFASTAPTLAKIGQAGWGGWLVRAAAFAAS